MAKEPYYKEPDGVIRPKKQEERRSMPRAPLNPNALYKMNAEGYLEEVEITGKVIRSKPIEPLRIRTQTWYKSRDGRKIMVHHANRKPSDKELVYVGMIEDKLFPDNYKPWGGDIDGKAKKPQGRDFDIVSEWSST